MKASWARGAAYVGAAFIMLGWTTAARPQPFIQTVLSQEVLGAFDVTAADFDNDGDMDIAASSRTQHSVLWIETQTGGPAITRTIWIGNLDGPCGVASGDFDGDGDADIAVATYSENRFVLLQNSGQSGADRFVEQTLLDSAAGAWSVRTGDMDGDGDLDLVTTEYRGNTVRWLRNNGGQFVTAGTTSVREPTNAIFADFDGDGDQDIVVASYMDVGLWIEQTPNNSWSRHTFNFNAITSDVAVGDLDGDGDQDIVTCRYANAEVSWWEHSGTQWLQHIMPQSIAHPRALQVADLDQDQRLDIIATGQSGELYWWENNGNRTFTAQNLPGGASFYGMDITDIDWDGDLDIVVADYAASAVLLFRSTLGIPSYLTGWIRTESGDEGIAGAMIRLEEVGVAAYSDADGHYSLPATIGDYTVVVRHPCWNTVQFDGVHLARAETTHVDASLRRGLIRVDATSLNLFAYNSVTTEAQISVENLGDGTLMIRAEAEGEYPNDPWLSVDPDSVEIASQGSIILTVSVTPDTSNSGLWDYFGRIILHNNSCPDSALSVAVLVTVLDAPDNDPMIPARTTLHPAYPNPFNATTAIRYTLAQPSALTLRLYDIMGREVQTLAVGAQPAGDHLIVVSADHLASGVYVVRMETGSTFFSERLILLK